MRDGSILESAPRGWRRSGYVDLHLDVGPATVISEITRRFARAVVDNHLEHVIARLAETRYRGCLAVGKYSPRFDEGDFTWTSILEPFVTETPPFTDGNSAASLGSRGRRDGIQLG